jgi:WD40 repeat protein
MSRFHCVAFLPLFALAATGATPPPETYTHWVATHAASADPLAILIITPVDDPPPHGDTDYHASYTVSADGRTSWESSNSFGHRGGDAAKRFLPFEIPLLQLLFATLPDDHQRLPPPAHRLLLQFQWNGRSLSRVYDRQNLPQPVLDVLRESGSGMGSFIPTIAPASSIPAGDDEVEGGLAVSPDRKHFATVANAQPIAVWDAATHRLIDRYRLSGLRNEIAFSPNGSQLVAGEFPCTVFNTSSWEPLFTFARPSAGDNVGYYYYDPIFTLDGQHLLLRWGHDHLAAFDAHTFADVPLPDLVPPGAVAFHPSPNGSFAVIQTKDRNLSLWNLHTHKIIAPLYAGTHRWIDAFSPDGRILALAYLPRENTAEGRGLDLLLFRTTDGAPLHQLRAGDIGSFEHLDTLLWSPDSCHLVAGGDGLFLWNTATGRQEAILDTPGSGGQCYGLGLLANNQIVADVENHTLFFYDLPAILERVAPHVVAVSNP